MVHNMMQSVSSSYMVKTLQNFSRCIVACAMYSQQSQHIVSSETARLDVKSAGLSDDHHLYITSLDVNGSSNCAHKKTR